MAYSSDMSLTRERANEILAEASALLVKYPELRLGQAICNVSTEEDWPHSWPELFHEEDPAKSADLLYSLVENQGRREGTLDASFILENRNELFTR